VTSRVVSNAHELACNCPKENGVCPCGANCKCAVKAMVAALKQVGYVAKEASCCGKALKTVAGSCACGPDCQCGPDCACAACPGKTCGKAGVACPARALGTCTCGESCQCGPDCSCAACPAKKAQQRETLNKLAVRPLEGLGPPGRRCLQVGGAIFAAGFLAAKVLKV
jgi:hypothetical protein